VTVLVAPDVRSGHLPDFPGAVVDESDARTELGEDADGEAT
jgi:hypothetical protein